MAGYLILALEAPMTSFGGEAIDNRGVVRDFPALSMLTGLCGNALGLDRSDADELDELQRRIVHASALVREGRRSREYQTARLFEDDAGWTTRGEPEGRARSPSFRPDREHGRADGTPRRSLVHERLRDYDADPCTLAALTLLPPSGAGGVDVDGLARALDRPERPLFIGRKPQLPSGPLLRARVEAGDPVTALIDGIAALGFRAHGARVQWPGDDEPAVQAPGRARFERVRRVRVGDERRHASGVHGGTRATCEAVLVGAGR